MIDLIPGSIWGSSRKYDNRVLVLAEGAGQVLYRPCADGAQTVLSCTRAWFLDRFSPLSQAMKQTPPDPGPDVSTNDVDIPRLLVPDVAIQQNFAYNADKVRGIASLAVDMGVQQFRNRLVALDRADDARAVDLESEVKAYLSVLAEVRRVLIGLPLAPMIDAVVSDHGRKLPGAA